MQILSTSIVRSNLEAFKDQVSSSWPEQVDFYYAMKANPHPKIIKLAIGASYGLECGGKSEIELAVNNGVRFIVNGSGKSTELLKLTAENGGVINIDSLDEFRRVAKLGTPARVALRLKFVFLEEPTNQAQFYFPKTSKSVNSYLATKRWGMNLDDINEVLSNNLPENIDFEGIHVHLGKLGKSFDAYSEIAIDLAKQLRLVFEATNHKIKSINLGGGWNDSNPNSEYSKFTASEIISHFLNALKKELNLREYPKLIFEPGQAIVSNASCTITRVTSIKSDVQVGLHWTHIDASTMTTTPVGNSLLGFNYEISNLSNINGKVIKTIVVGAPCMGTYLAQNVQLPSASEGDLLVVWDTGAYSYGLQNDFNGYSAATEVWLEELMSKQRGEK